MSRLDPWIVCSCAINPIIQQWNGESYESLIRAINDILFVYDRERLSKFPVDITQGYKHLDVDRLEHYCFLVFGFTGYPVRFFDYNNTRLYYNDHDYRQVLLNFCDTHL